MADKFELIRNGQRIWGPGVYDAMQIRPIVASIGLNPTLVPNIITTKAQLSENVSIKPIQDLAPKLRSRLEGFAPGQRRVEEHNRVLYYFTRIELDTDMVVDKMLSTLDTIRTRDLESRTPYEGVDIKFNDKALGRISAKVLQWQSGVGTTQQWEGAAITDEEGNKGPSTITLDSLEKTVAVATFIGKRMGVSFTAAQTVQAEIEALRETNDRETLATYDIPAAYKAAIESLMTA